MTADTRVYEITGPDAWADLVGRYPMDVSRARRHDWWRTTRRAGRWLIPDYLAVTADFDAVHLSVAGYLTTAPGYRSRPRCSQRARRLGPR